MIPREKIVGLDPSLTATGVAVWQEGDIDTYTLRPPRTLRGGARLDWIGNQLVVATDGASVVAAEGYAYRSRGSGISLGELGGVLRRMLFRQGTPLYTVPPASVKKFATGQGNASKEAVLVAAVHSLGYAGNSTDEADALWILTFAMAKSGLIDRVQLTPNQRAAIDAVNWSPQ